MKSRPETLHQFADPPPYLTCLVPRVTSLELRQIHLPQLELEVATQRTQEDHNGQDSLRGHGSGVTPTRLDLLLPSINVWHWCCRWSRLAYQSQRQMYEKVCLRDLTAFSTHIHSTRISSAPGWIWYVDDTRLNVDSRTHNTLTVAPDRCNCTPTAPRL